MTGRMTGQMTAWVDGVRALLGDELRGVHLVGERALGAPRHAAPIELVVVTGERLGPGHLAALEGRHTHDPDLGVVYAPSADLRSPMTVGRAWPRSAPGSSTLAPSSLDNTLRARWVLRERARTLLGEAAAASVATVDAGALRAEMIGLARAQAEGIEEDPASLRGPDRRRALVTTMCSAWHTTCTGEVTHRAAARAWAAEALTGRHADLRAVVLALFPRDPDATGTPAPDDAAVRAFAWELHRLVGAEALARRQG